MVSNDIVSKITNFKLYLTKVKGYLENSKKYSKLMSSAKQKYYKELGTFLVL